MQQQHNAFIPQDFIRITSLFITVHPFTIHIPHPILYLHMWQSPGSTPRGPSPGCDGLLSTGTGLATTTTTPQQFLFHHAVTFLSSHHQSCPHCFFTYSTILDKNSHEIKHLSCSSSVCQCRDWRLETSIVYGNQTKHTSTENRETKIKKCLH